MYRRVLGGSPPPRPGLAAPTAEVAGNPCRLPGPPLSARTGRGDGAILRRAALASSMLRGNTLAFSYKINNNFDTLCCLGLALFYPLWPGCQGPICYSELIVNDILGPFQGRSRGILLGRQQIGAKRVEGRLEYALVADRAPAEGYTMHDAAGQLVHDLGGRFVVEYF